MLDHVSQVLVAVVNGLIGAVGALVDLRTGLVALTLLGLLWLAAVEVEDLDRRSTKPTIRRH